MAQIAEFRAVDDVRAVDGTATVPAFFSSALHRIDPLVADALARGAGKARRLR